MTARPPVTDWIHDFDHQDARWVEDPYPIWDELRTRCPIAHTGRYHGVWMPTRYEDVRAIAYDPQHFSSARVVVRDEYLQGASAPPITSDPPEHRPARMVLLPAFTAKAIERYEGETRAICDDLIDRFDGRDECDAAVEYAQHIPVRIIAHMLGVPQEEGDRFRQWIQWVLIDGISDLSALQRGFREMTEFFMSHVLERQARPGDDLISYLLSAEFEGKRFDVPHVLGTLRLLLIAGIDTTWSAIGASLWHLASHPEDASRLRAEPELMPTAVEEFLRAYSPVTMARVVREDVEFNGCPMKAGESILLSFPSANRDPEVFEHPERVMIDRLENRHAAFGLGIHRCIGSNLARMELTVAIERWLARIPAFRLHPQRRTEWSIGTVRGPRKLPVLLG